MKIKLFLFTSLLLILASCKQDAILLDTTNHLATFSKVKTQTFKLDTLHYLIKGEKGTTIWFNRNDFAINESDIITAELREYYSFNDILYNNINTITDKNELLESSGVIYLNFTVNNKPVKLKKGKELLIEFPVKSDFNNRIYKAEIDSLGKFRWINKSVKTQLLARSKQIRGVIVEDRVMVPSDSISFYQTKFKKDLLESKRIDSIRNLEYLNLNIKHNKLTISIIDFGYINIDKIKNFDKNIKYSLSIQNKKLENISIYVIYDNLNSFISFYRTTNNIYLGEIPVIFGKTKLVVISEFEGKYYAKSIRLTKDLKIDINLRLKNIEFLELKELFNH